MQHPDDGDLALLALGIDPQGPGAIADPGAASTPPAEVAAHVADCDQCRAEVGELARVVDLARQGDLGELMPPPPHVWASIAAELGLGGSSAAGGLPGYGGGAALRLLPRDVDVAGAPQPVGSARSLVPADPPPVRPDPAVRAASRTGRTRRSTQVFSAVAAAVVIGVAGALIGYAVRAPQPDPPAVGGSAALAAVPGGPGTPAESGIARLLRTADGAQVRVDAAGLPTVDGAYEVWLFGPDGRMVSLGVLDRGTGTFTVPHGIDPNAYRTVDISDEPADGNPVHSGVSVLRGVIA